MTEIMHPVYLPFTKEQLMSHFADVKRNGECTKNAEHLKYYLKSVEEYNEYLANHADKLGSSLREMILPCQIEKDERFWTAACMMTVFHSETREQELAELFREAYGEKPPIKMINNWKECLDGELHLFFEANLPSPRTYKEWLKKNIARRQFIPYVLSSADNKSNLEGATNVDALLLNSENGFAVIVEAKVLSDISTEITYDVMRNQIARNIDVMLEKNDLCPPLNKRDPEKTLFLLITPGIFKENQTSRMYGYKFNEYKINPNSLARDLLHREDCDWKSITERLGWLTWEDFKKTNKNCCRWLQ